jgi:PAS domain S-box-containing protein
MNRELRAISLCEQALIRATDETTLLQEVCQIICEAAGHRMAWVGYALHDEAKTVQPMAWAGHEDGYLKVSLFSWADTEFGRSPAGRAIRSGLSVGDKNMGTDAAIIPSASAAQARGYQSGICLPLKNADEEVLGILTIYSSDIGAFHETEIKLLEKLADDLAFGIRAIRDRSERKRAEAALENSEREFRSLAESMPQIVWITRADGWNIYFNQQWVEYTGLTLEESYGHGWNIPFHPDDRQRAWDVWKNATENGTTYSLECRLRRADGTYRWWLIRGVPHRDADGKILKWFGTCTDIEQLQAEITERRHVEEELHKSLELSERSRLAMLSTMEDQQRKADACVLNAQRMESLLGLNKMIGVSLQQIMDYALEESVRLTRSEIGYLAFLNEDESVLTMNSWSRSAMKECAMDNKPRRYPVVDTGLWGEAIRQRRPVITNDYAAANPLKKGCPHGHVFLKNHMNVPVFEGSRIVIVAGVGNKDEAYDLDDVQELTLLMEGLWRLLEHRRAEEELRESEQRYRSLFSSMSEGFALHELLFDQQGMPCDYRFLTVNPAFEKLTGFKAENIVGKSLRQILPDEPLFWLDVYSKVVLAGEPVHFDHYSPQLQRHYDVFAYRPAPNQFATIVNDITERKRIEDVQRFLAQMGSGGVSEPFFNALARFLAQSLKMDFVCIDRLEGDGLNARTVAVWCDGRFEDNVTYALKDTPCGDVVGKQVCCFPSSVCQFFPRDQVLQDLRAESYVGVTLFSHVGSPIGLIAVIGRASLANRSLAEATLQQVAVRAAGELERLDATELLRKSERLNRSLVEHLPHRVFIKDLNSVYVSCNANYAHDLGLSPEQIIGKDDFAFHQTELAVAYRADDRAVIESDRMKELEEPYFLGSHKRWAHTTKVPFRDESGKIIGILGVFEDITLQKRLETVLWESLQEKESLLKEIHHRVKNNLQIISSLLRLQAGKIENSEAKAALNATQDRVRSMALTHEHLYRSENLAAVDMAAYLKHLCQQLFRTLAATPETIHLRLELDSVNLGVDQAIPCGLLVNELVTNAFKHAFPGDRGGEVRVELHSLGDGQRWRLLVADDGVGLPPGFDVLNMTSSLGVKLIGDLATQLGGTLVINPGGGACGTVFEVTLTPSARNGQITLKEPTP